MKDGADNGRLWIKRAIQGCSLLYAFPAALLCGFGRVGLLFNLFAQCFALLPGFIGSFARAAFYKMTLEDSSIDVVTGIGTYFSRCNAVIEGNVSIGSYCVIGPVRVGRRCQISSHVEIPGGRAQHLRDSRGRLSGTVEGASELLTIGEDCWIGASAVVMANIGARSTVGAGSVVVRDIPSGVVAVGAPARVIKDSYEPADPARPGS